jgi:hypothetical protein
MVNVKVLFHSGLRSNKDFYMSGISTSYISGYSYILAGISSCTEFDAEIGVSSISGESTSDPRHERLTLGYLVPQILQASVIMEELSLYIVKFWIQEYNRLYGG